MTILQEDNVPAIEEVAELLELVAAMSHTLGPAAANTAQVALANTAGLRKALHQLRLEQVPQAWELYQAYLGAGFSPQQAFSLLQRAGSRGETSLARDGLQLLQLLQAAKGLG